MKIAHGLSSSLLDLVDTISTNGPEIALLLFLSLLIYYSLLKANSRVCALSTNDKIIFTVYIQTKCPLEDISRHKFLCLGHAVSAKVSTVMLSPVQWNSLNL